MARTSESGVVAIDDQLKSVAEALAHNIARVSGFNLGV